MKIRCMIVPHVTSRLTAIASMAACCALLSTIGCDRSESSTGATTSTAAASANLPDGLIVDVAPSAPKEVLAAKQQVQAGQSIVVHGRIGGSKSPFVDGRAIFTLADMSMPTCSENPGDSCETPWDYCCEPVDEIRKRTLTVQIADESGRPLKVNLHPGSPLRPMAELTIEGKVTQQSGGDVLVINASRIFLHR